jgi:uncharacterized repeat protein (TIGR03806 family)
MNKIFSLLLLSMAAFVLSVGYTFKPTQAKLPFGVKLHLSAYGFFEGKLALLQPAKGVMPYALNTPLFSDYAQKSRFIRLPQGSAARYHAQEVLEFPVGTVLIKNFFYPIDARQPSQGRRLVETRLLIHETKGWRALPYVWNKAQTEATLEVAGDTQKVSWVDAQGNTRALDYMVPNVNECKGCHVRGKQMQPIGPSARQLNGTLAYAGQPKNQLLHWQKTGMLQGLPPLAQVPKAPVWNNPATGNVTARARIWLDINCGHCHRPDGPANTSGLFLYIHEQNRARLGVLKSPIAAGTAARHVEYDIVPGKPMQSLLVTRLMSTSPGERMPELGRQLVHKESLQLIKEWIRQMKTE